jgi:O-antigen ligase
LIALGYPFGAGYFGAWVMMGLMLLAILWSLAWRAPIWSFRQRPAARMMLTAFGLILLAHVASARTPSDVAGAGNFVMLAFFVPLSGFMGQLARPRNLELVGGLALLGSCFSIGLALSQIFYVGMDRATGWGADPIWSSEAALIAGFLAMAGWYAPRSWLPRGLYLLGPLFGTLTVFLTGSRGPLLAVPLLVVALAVVGPRVLRLGLVAGLVIAGLAALGIHFFWAWGAMRVDSVFVNLRDMVLMGHAADGSVDARLTFWRIGIAAFEHSPVWGYGWKHFLDAAYAYLPDGGAGFRSGLDGLANNHHLHADILDLGVAAGSLGIIAYGLVIAAPLVGAFRSVRDAQHQGRVVGALVLSIGYFVCGLSYLMFGFEFHTTLYVVLVATVVGFCRDAPAMPARLPGRRSDARLDVRLSADGRAGLL